MSDPVERLEAAGTADDPSTNPVLLPPRTRADVVQDRPAGGTPDEVAAANPALAAAVPETVGVHQDADAGAATTGNAAVDEAKSQQAGDRSTSDAGAPSATTNPTASSAAVGSSGGFTADAAGGLGAVGDMSDGSGMEVPELAMLGR